MNDHLNEPTKLLNLASGKLECCEVATAASSVIALHSLARISGHPFIHTIHPKSRLVAEVLWFKEVALQ
jgi:hypothetical protein